jgi:carbamoyl-phosphate synthase large subunit
MNNSTILISAICGDIGSSAVRSLRDIAKKIVGCDMKSYSPVSHLVDKFYKAPAASDISSYMAFLEEVIARERVHFFLPISEPEIEVLNQRRKDLENLGVKLLLNNPKILNTFLDKLKTVQFLQRLNIRVPKTIFLSEMDGSFKFPVIVKPRKSHGSKRLWKVNNADELEYLRNADDGTFLVQEYIGSDEEEYTTGVFSDGNTISSITFRRKLGLGGLSTEAILTDADFVDDLAHLIAKETELVGSINIQSRRDGDIFVPFEVNPRLSSTLPFRKRFGFDDAVWWLQVLLGKGYSYRKKFRTGIAIRCLSECYFDMEEIEDDNR